MEDRTPLWHNNQRQVGAGRPPTRHQVVSRVAPSKSCRFGLRFGSRRIAKHLQVASSKRALALFFRPIAEEIDEEEHLEYDFEGKYVEAELGCKAVGGATCKTPFSTCCGHTKCKGGTGNKKCICQQCQPYPEKYDSNGECCSNVCSTKKRAFPPSLHTYIAKSEGDLICTKKQAGLSLLFGFVGNIKNR